MSKSQRIVSKTAFLKELCWFFVIFSGTSGCWFDYSLNTDGGTSLDTASDMETGNDTSTTTNSTYNDTDATTDTIDDCYPNPCVHGTCVYGVDSYSCNCDPAWTGTNCDDTVSYRRLIVINHQKVGTNNSGTLPANGFPVLISLSGNWLKTISADAQNGRIRSNSGHDISFRKSDGSTILYHEIEKYDGSAGTLVSWVRVDSLSKSADTSIYILYGDISITSSTEASEEVWDPGYKGVWHLKENGDGTVDEFKDSSGNGNHGQGGDGDSDKTPNQVTGGGAKIGNAQDFDGLNDYVGLGNPGALDFGTGSWSVSAWIRTLSPTKVDAATIYSKGGDDAGGIRYVLGVRYYPDAVMNFITDDNSTKHDLYSTTVVADGEWHYLVGLRNGNELKIYIDGQNEVTQIISSGYDLSGTSQRNAYIGARISEEEGVIKKWADGEIDEVRVSGVARSADWIMTSYNNQSDTSIGVDKFIKSLGPEQ